MRVKQLIRGNILDGHHGKISAEEISEAVKAIVMEDLLKTFGRKTAMKIINEPEVFGPTIDGRFCVVYSFPDDCEETLRKARNVFQSRHPDRVKIINSASIKGEVDLESRIDCGL